MSADLTTRMLHLRQIPIAAMLPASIVQKLAAALNERVLADGEPLLTQGQPMEAMYLLTDGALSLTKDGAPFGTLSAPQTIGFLPILAGLTTPYDAAASGEVRAFELDADLLLDLMADHFELLEATVRYFAERLWLEFQQLPAAALGIAGIDVDPVPEGEVDLVARILMFRKVSGFASANVNALAVMVRQIEEVRLPPDVVLWRAGDDGDRVLFLVHGSIVCRAPDGRTFRYGAGSGVGGIEALAQRPRWFEAKTETAIVGFWGDTENLLDLFEQQLRMALDFVAMLARAQIGILAMKAKMGQDPHRTAQDVAKLGSIRYGA